MGAKFKTTAIAIAVSLIGALLALPAAVFTAAPASAATIASAGPLTAVTTSPDLNCAVNHTGDAFGEFYQDTACGTLASVNGALYSPATIPAGQPGIGWTPVSQVGPTGTGTAGDPFRVVTVVDAGATGVRLTQTDTYVVGTESFRTDVARVANIGGASATVRLYRAGDCFLQDSDTGFGVVEPTSGAVACKSPSSDRIEQFLPITPGSAYYEARYNEVWSQITAQAAFTNTCRCDELVDNGAGLSWDAVILPGASTTISSILTFSPLGVVPLTVSKTADAPTTAAVGANGYTITVDNPNPIPASLSSIVDTLPAGFTYVPGTTTGATTADPSIGADLTWGGPISVPGEGSVSLHFGVTVSNTPGTYSNNASAVAAGFTVAPTGATAPITVTAAVVLGITSSGQPTSVTAGANAQRTVTVSNTGAAAATGTSVSVSVPAGVTLISRTPSQGSCGTVVAGVVTCTLGTVGAGGSADVVLVLQMPATVPVGGTVSTSASATAAGGASAGPAVSATTVTAQAPGVATGFVPAGGTITTGPDATPTDNTVSSLTLPNTGPGAVVTLTSVPCAAADCVGKTVIFNSFAGYNDPAHPFKLTQTWDKSVAGNGLLSQLYVKKDNQTSFSVVPPCQPAPQLEKVWDGKKWIWKIKQFIVTVASWLAGGHTGYANPSPCVDAKSILKNGDVKFEALFLSGDPAVRRR